MAACVATTTTTTTRGRLLWSHDESSIITTLLHIPLDLLFFRGQNETVHIFILLFLYSRRLLWSGRRMLFLRFGGSIIIPTCEQI